MIEALHLSVQRRLGRRGRARAGTASCAVWLARSGPRFETARVEAGRFAGERFGFSVGVVTSIGGKVASFRRNILGHRGGRIGEAKQARRHHRHENRPRKAQWNADIVEKCDDYHRRDLLDATSCSPLSHFIPKHPED